MLLPSDEVNPSWTGVFSIRPSDFTDLSRLVLMKPFFLWGRGGEGLRLFHPWSSIRSRPLWDDFIYTAANVFFLWSLRWVMKQVHHWLSARNRTLKTSLTDFIAYVCFFWGFYLSHEPSLPLSKCFELDMMDWFHRLYCWVTVCCQSFFSQLW